MKAPLSSLAMAIVLGASVAPTDISAENGEGRLPPLDGATAWLNSQPLTAHDLRGKVVLVDFWTYTCINWRRTLPYLRSWSKLYKDEGLVVLGVHTPEFSFEKDVANVRVAAKAQNVDYPILVDSNYAVWNAFQNQYWPALYIVDAQGHIRHHQFGEGGYEESERVIRQLLAEAGHASPDPALASVEAEGSEAPADWKSMQTPETYLGYARAENFMSPGGATPGRARLYAPPATLRLNAWSLTGRWTIKSEFAVSQEANGRISYRFHARDVHLVMGPTKRGTAVRFRVSIDGQLPGASHGVDVNTEGLGTLDEPRMYQLLRQPAPIVDRQVEIEFLDPGAEIYVFTFG